MARKRAARPRNSNPATPVDLGALRARGTRRRLALDKIADDAGEDILNAMVGAAKGGDMRAAELVLSEDLACPQVTADRIDAAGHSIGLRRGRGCRRCG